jgi:alkanesulfonate monooxygenase SsuD/methylene tetrahydromethanopterin reductase-like flavin-dependent oxidoreductase (luciferase family)
MRRLGLYLGRLPGFDKRGFDRRGLIECVRAADSCGYDSFWMPEAWERDAFATLAELATTTKRIRLATGIVNVFSRSPALIAMSAATIDDISGGRFLLGLGTSGARVIEDFHGIRYDKPLTRLKETVHIIRTLLAGERVDFEGECFNLRRFKLGFKPLRGAIPIYIAALTQGGLRQVGRLADGWLPTLWPRSRLQDGITEIKVGADSSGREVSNIEVAPFINVTDSRESARLPLAYYVGGMGNYYHAALARLGFAVQADLIRQLWQSGRPRDAIRAVTDEMVDAIAICGTVEERRAGLDEIYALGATLPLVPIPAEGSTLDKCRWIESLVQ